MSGKSVKLKGSATCASGGIWSSIGKTSVGFVDWASAGRDMKRMLAQINR